MRRGAIGRERERERENVRSLHFPLARLVDLSLMKSTHTQQRQKETHRRQKTTTTRTTNRKIGKIKEIAVGFLTLASTVCSLSFVPSKHF